MLDNQTCDYLMVRPTMINLHYNASVGLTVLSLNIPTWNSLSEVLKLKPCSVYVVNTIFYEECSMLLSEYFCLRPPLSFSTCKTEQTIGVSPIFV